MKCRKTTLHQKQRRIRHLSLEDVDFSVLDVDLIAEVPELIGYSVLVLRGRQRRVRLLLNHLVLLLQLLAQLIDLERGERASYTMVHKASSSKFILHISFQRGKGKGKLNGSLAFLIASDSSPKCRTLSPYRLRRQQSCQAQQPTGLRSSRPCASISDLNVF